MIGSLRGGHQLLRLQLWVRQPALDRVARLLLARTQVRLSESAIVPRDAVALGLRRRRALRQRSCADLLLRGRRRRLLDARTIVEEVGHAVRTRTPRCG